MGELNPEFEVMDSFDVRQIGPDAHVIESPLLADGLGLVRKWIRAGIIPDLVKPVIRVDCQECVWIEGMDISRRDVQRADQLSLVLPQSLLVERIREIETVPSQK